MQRERAQRVFAHGSASLRKVQKKNKAKNKAKAPAAVSLLKHGDLLAVQLKVLGAPPVWTR